MREKDRETVRVSVPVSMNQHMLVIEYEEGLREGERERERERERAVSEAHLK